MKSQLYIPKKLKIGFQNRSDTFTGKLSYIIYYDDKNVLRKQKSWEGWCDKTIEPIEVDNKPISGFVINKDVKRSSDWYNSGRTMVRIWDPRGFEFEITTNNLMFILMSVDCSKRGLVGDFVYSWVDKQLVLLPIDSLEYSECVNYTNLQSQKVKAKELIPGCYYLTKKQVKLYYIGKLPWYDTKYVRKHQTYTSSKEVKHLFLTEPCKFNNNKKQIISQSTATLGQQLTSQADAELGNALDTYNQSHHSDPVELIENEQVVNIDERIKSPYNNPLYGKLFIKDKDQYIEIILSKYYSYRPFNWRLNAPEPEPNPDFRYTIELYSSYKIENNTIIETPIESNKQTHYTEDTIKDVKFYTVNVKLKNNSIHPLLKLRFVHF